MIESAEVPTNASLPQVVETASLPAEVRLLAPRMRQIATIVYELRVATLTQIADRIDDDVTIYGIRTLLSRLVRRGLIKRRRSGRHAEIAYLPGIVTERMKREAVEELVATSFEGSTKDALATVLRLVKVD